MTRREGKGLCSAKPEAEDTPNHTGHGCRHRVLGTTLLQDGIFEDMVSILVSHLLSPVLRPETEVLRRVLKSQKQFKNLHF